MEDPGTLAGLDGGYEGYPGDYLAEAPGDFASGSRQGSLWLLFEFMERSSMYPPSRRGCSRLQGPLIAVSLTALAASSRDQPKGSMYYALKRLPYHNFGAAVYTVELFGAFGKVSFWWFTFQARWLFQRTLAGLNIRTTSVAGTSETGPLGF